MTNLHEAREVLRETGWLSRMPVPFREAVLMRAILRRYERGSVIVRAGDEPKGLFAVVDGLLRVSVASERHNPFSTYVFKRGSWFGEAPTLTGDRYIIGLTATRDSTLLHVHQQALSEILVADPGAWRHLGQLAIEHIQITLGIMADMTVRDPLQRIVALLVRLIEADSEIAQEGSNHELDITQNELASIANLSRTTVNPLLRKLENDGLIRLDYRKLVIPDVEALKPLIRD